MTLPLPEPRDVMPFSNGTDADVWMSLNCRRCARQSDPCAIAEALSLGRTWTGPIPAALARRAGAVIEDQVDADGCGYANMPRQCAEYSPRRQEGS